MILVTWLGEVSWGGITRDDMTYIKKALPQSFCFLLRMTIREYDTDCFVN